MRSAVTCIIFLAMLSFHLRAQDTDEVKQGVIVIKKPVTTPFVKVEYGLWLSRVQWVDEIVYYHGMPETNRVPAYDSGMYSNNLERSYPKKSLAISRYFALNMNYQYPAADTPRIDTLVLGLYLDETGVIAYVDPDTEDARSMNAELRAELSSIAMSIEDQYWGNGGGYYLPPKGLRGKQLVSESYYCELTVIVSSMPLTDEQKRTRSLFPSRDIPLNTEPVDMDIVQQDK